MTKVDITPEERLVNLRSLVSLEDVGWAVQHIDAQAERIKELEAQQDADMRDLVKAEVIALTKREARNDALREAAEVSRKISGCCQSCAYTENRILTLIEGDKP